MCDMKSSITINTGQDHVTIPVPSDMEKEAILTLVKDVGNTIARMTRERELSVTYSEYSAITQTWPCYVDYYPFENHLVNNL